MIVRHSTPVDLDAGHPFNLTGAAEHCPALLPWRTGAQIVSRDATRVSANIQMHCAGMDFSLCTRNPKRRPDYRAIHPKHGPMFHPTTNTMADAFVARARPTGAMALSREPDGNHPL